MSVFVFQTTEVCVCECEGLKAAIRRTLSARCMSCRLEAAGCNMKYVRNNEAACKHCAQVTGKIGDNPKGGGA